MVREQDMNYGGYVRLRFLYGFALIFLVGEFYFAAQARLVPTTQRDQDGTREK
jgi:hypothetical protein